MLTAVDRVQIVVRDREQAAETLRGVLGAVDVRADDVRALGARRAVVQAGTCEFELLEPDGDGPAADFLAQRGEGLFGAGFATPDLDALCRRLEQKGVTALREGEQAFLTKQDTAGMRIVLSPARARQPVGLIGHIYEVTLVVSDWEGARDRLVDLFDLDAGRFSPINSSQWGYVGTLTLFDPPAKLDRVEIVTPNDPGKAMGKFHGKRGGELYMCYVETDDVDAIAGRLEARNGRFMGRGERGKMDGLFIHPSAFHGVLVGVSRTTVAWNWSGHPELVAGGGGSGH